MTNEQIVSKQRVSEHGEVFTNPREVNAMLDLVKQETERIDSRFLEPACGKGAFISEVLHRKLRIVSDRYAKSPVEYERYAVLAISSIYGIDILEDNVADCRQEMLKIFKDEYKSALKQDCSPECEASVRFILSKNIIWGDALTLKRVDNDLPIVFSEWSAVNGKMMKRRDFSFSNILNCSTEGLPLLSDLNEDVWLPKPIKDFPLTHYLELENAEKL
ncbi:MAG: SAM-dependent DNA methyltransferase [Alphaproteobacteria bacterium]|nr:SAM-dependent DNA methyltransferase [Alphaproteobacteria bacterium]